jgi:hypothetical protein
MRTLSRQYVFQRVYDMAALVEGSVQDDSSFLELNWDDPELVKSLAAFSKITVLHRYIFAMIAVQYRYDYRKNADIYEESPELIKGTEDWLRAYDIDFLPYSKFQAAIPISQAKTRADYPFHQWFLNQETQFEQLWEKITEEVFYLLFGNRTFLLTFNVALTTWIRNQKVTYPSGYLNEQGTIKRVFMPRWVRDAVFFRDHGRCVFCHVDLSGLLSLEQLDHFDHMVPLALGGVNDPTNVQLLCEQCNLKKGDSDARTGLRYPAWWRD